MNPESGDLPNDSRVQSSAWSSIEGRRYVLYKALSSLLALCLLPGSVSGQEEQDVKHVNEKENLVERQKWLKLLNTGGVDVTSKQRAAAIRKLRVAEKAKRTARREAVNDFPEPLWRPIGPAPSQGGELFNSGNGPAGALSGRVSAMAVDPRNRDVVYAGGASGGIWKTIDGGSNWTPLTDFEASLSTGAIGLDPTNPNIIYVGTGEPANVAPGHGVGVLKSIDGGQTWTQLGEQALNPSGATVHGYPVITGLSISPNGKRILVAVIALTHSENWDNGLFLSLDGGLTWSKQLSNITPYSVEFATDQIAYAGIAPIGPPTAGVYKSVDGGSSWTPVLPFPDAITNSRVEIAVSKQNPHLVFAAVQKQSASDLQGVYKTINGGSTWTKLDIDDFCGPQCWYDMVIAVSPVNDNIVFVGGSGTLKSIQRSVDGGLTWEKANANIHVDQHALAFSGDGSRLYAGNDGGVNSTENINSDSVVWKNLNTTLQLTQFYPFMGMHPLDIGYALAGTQDNGTNLYLGTSTWLHVGCGDGASAVISGTTVHTMYYNCGYSSLFKSVRGQPATFYPAVYVPDSAPFLPVAVGDPENGEILYFGAASLWATRDGARSWFRFSAPVADTLNGGFVLTIALAPGNRDIMYIGGSNGTVFRSLDARNVELGEPAHWIKGGSGLPGAAVRSIAVDARDAMKAYATANGEVWKTGDGGQSWVGITSNLPDVPAFVVAIDPDIPGTIYVGTEIGVFSTPNEGSSWSILGRALPNVAVIDLKLHRASRTLRAATHGRGMWDVSLPVTYAGAALAIVPPTFSFGDVPLGTTSQKTLTLMNVGGESLTISKIISTGPFGAAHACTAISVGATCSVVVSFHPDMLGVSEGAIDIESNAINGTGTARVGGYGTRSADNDTFQTARWIGSSPYQERVTTLNATGEASDPKPFCPFSNNDKSVWYRYQVSEDAAITIDTLGSDYTATVSVWRGSPPQFAFVGCGALPLTFDARTVQVEFTATAGEIYTIFVTDRNKLGGLLVLNAKATPLPTSAEISHHAMGFGTQIINHLVPSRVVTVSNSGTNHLLLLGINVTGRFSIHHNCPARLPPGSACDIEVSFLNDSLGENSGYIQIVSNAAGSPHQVSLTGSSIDLVLSLIRPKRSPRNPIALGQAQVLDVIVMSGAVRGTVSFGCGSIPAGARCTVSPSVATLEGKPIAIRVVISVGSRALRLGGHSTRLPSSTLQLSAQVGNTLQSIEIPIW